MSAPSSWRRPARWRIAGALQREVARGQVAGPARRGGQLRVLVLAALPGDRAAGAEPAARRDPQRAGRVALDGRGLVDGAGRHPRDGGQQAAGVGVARLGVQLLGRRHLDDPAQVHDRDPVAQVPDHGQVVRDEQQGQAQAGLQVLQQVQDRGLHADVQRRHRLVGHQQAGRQGQRPGDRDPLPLPAGELARVGLQRVRVQARPGRISSRL